MHTRWLVPPIAALVLLMGCERTERAREERAPAPRAAEVSAPRPEACALGEAKVALGSDAPVFALGLAQGEGGTVLVAASDEGTLAFTRLDAAGAPAETRRAPFPRARALVAATAWGARTAAIAHGPCHLDQDRDPDGDRGRGAHCLHVVALDSAGLLEAASVPLAQPIERLRLASSEGLLVVARSHAEGPPYADLFRASGRRLVVSSVRLGDARFPGEHHAEALAAAASGDRYAVAIRVGAIEDPSGALVLATRDGLFELEALHEAAMVDALAFDPARPGELALLASFEFSRPLVFRVSERGALAAGFVEVPHGAEVGPPFPAGEVGRLGRDATGLFVHRRTLGGDGIGAPVRVAGPEPARAAIAKRAGDYLVAIAPRSEPYGVRTVLVRCRGR